MNSMLKRLIAVLLSLCMIGSVLPLQLWAAEPAERPVQQGEQPGNTDNPFTDVSAGAWYYKAVLWAYENGVTGGTGDGTTFSPKNACTRAQVVTFLYKAFGQADTKLP